MTHFYSSFLVFAVLLVAFLTAYLVSKSDRFLFLDDRGRRYGCIDGLRGYLAILVFVHHFVVTLAWKKTGDWGYPDSILFENLGRVSVAVFFLITGFLFINRVRLPMSFSKWVVLYKSRVFRVYPLYMFVVFLVFLYSFDKVGLVVDKGVLLKETVKWVLFKGGSLNGNEEARTVIAQVDWTLIYEWCFYCSLPVFAVCFKKMGYWAIGAFVVLSVFLNIYPFYFSFVRISSEYFLLFALGGVCAFGRGKMQSLVSVEGKWASLLALAFLVVSMLYPNPMDVFHVFLIFCFFVFIVLGNDLFGILSCRSSLVLGEVSYSVYLTHGLVLYFVYTKPIGLDPDFGDGLWAPLVMVVAVVLFSSVTYLFIEAPAMKFGKRKVLFGRW